MQKLSLAGTKSVSLAYLVLVFGMPFEDHELLVVENQVRPFIKCREHSQRIVEFLGEASRQHIAACGLLAEFNQSQHRLWQCVADAGNRAYRSATDKPMKDLRVDANHQRQRRITACDVFGGIGQRLRSAKFLEADKILMFTP